MSSQHSTVDFILEQISEAGDVSAKKMFGEYGLYCDGKMVASICDDQLFVKPTAGGRSLLKTATEASPYPGAKPCFLISADMLEDREALTELIKVTTRELPVPVKKKAPARGASSLKKAPAQRR
jgi:TfoX/Sxy family transcriptional regulator of competence genes